MSDGILVLNAGSSSIKFAVFDDENATARKLLSGQISDIGSRAAFSATLSDGSAVESGGFGDFGDDHASVLAGLLDWLGGRADLPDITGIGHRVVHGGTNFSEPVIIADVMLGALEKLIPLAPHHQPHNLGAIRAVSGVWPHLPQVACFDTAFHASQPGVAQETGLPRIYTVAGIRRYGFHGLSYEYITRAFPENTGMPLPNRLIVAHLGNGASLCAIENGRSIAATMGFSTVDGIAMATRSGAVDPGALIEVMRRENIDADGLEDLLYNKSGLLGLSGISADMRVLLEHDAPEAMEAVDYYCFRIVREIGALVATLGGVDALVFTGGVGANSDTVRNRVCCDSVWLGVKLDFLANACNDMKISTPDSKVAVYAFDTDEESVIAEHTIRLLAE